jgi:hypothetical protein
VEPMTDGSLLGGSHKLPRKSPGSSPVRRIGSESQINGALANADEATAVSTSGYSFPLMCYFAARVLYTCVHTGDILDCG